MSQVRFYLSKRGERKKSLPIILKYTFTGEPILRKIKDKEYTCNPRFEYYTRYSVDKNDYIPKYWKSRSGQPIKSDATDAEYLNGSLELLKKQLLNIELNAKLAGIPLTEKLFRDELDLVHKNKVKQEPEEEPEMTLTRFVEKYINHDAVSVNGGTGHKLSQTNKEKYIQIQVLLNDYSVYCGRTFDFVDMDKEFYNGFVSYMNDVKRYAKNTAGRKIKFLKTILHASVEQGYNQNVKFIKAFKGFTEDVDNVYLDEAELDKIYKAKLPPHLDRVRDLFLIGCWTGLRYSDYSQIKRQHISGEFIKIRTIKTGADVVIPLFGVTREILEKYDYELPRPLSNQKFNEEVKDVAEAAGINTQVVKNITRAGINEVITGEKYKFISSHTARRSFSSNAIRKGVEPSLIMKITGHKSVKEFQKYVKLTADQNAKLFKEKSGWK